jgi:hypothetical protein
MNYDLNDCQQFSFITPLFFSAKVGDVVGCIFDLQHTKSKSWRRCRLYFRDKMQRWWIFDSETDYTLVSQRAFCDTENSFTKINFIASFLVIIECGVGIDSKFQC